MKKNLNKNNLLKFKLFNLFKKKMEKNKIVWVVVGGLNNYPKQLGRDMDVVIKDKNKINKVQSIFKSCLKDLNINHIMYKEDFYGNLIIAFLIDIIITTNYIFVLVEFLLFFFCGN